MDYGKILGLALFWAVGLSYTVQAEDVLPDVGVTPPPPPSDVATDKDDNITIKTDKPLTENLKANAETASDSVFGLPKVGLSDVFSDKITDIEKEGLNTAKSAGETLAGMISNNKADNQAEVKIVRRSNASVFDISGVMLRMSPQQVDAALIKHGFKKTMQKLDIPNFIRWRNEEKCRAQGVIGFERLESCVVQMAKKDNHQFIERVFYAKYDTQEEMEVRFTSNFTQNKSYYITYKSSVLTNLRGNSQKEIYLRNIKAFDFWKRINQKYGAPDNKENVIWGLGGNKPYLQAGTGRLRLEDPTLRELDYTRMSREDKRFMSTGIYNF